MCEKHFDRLQNTWAINKYVLKVLTTIICTFLFQNNILSQSNKSSNYFIDFRVATLGSFGPSKGQAEIVGGIDSVSFDNKRHLMPGFKNAVPIELTMGYQKKLVQFKVSLSFYNQNIGFIQTLSKNEYLLLSVGLVSTKISSMIQFSDYEKRGPNGFKAGIFICNTFPVSINMFDATTTEFGISKIKPTSQFHWGIDYSYQISISKKGVYFIGTASTTLPGSIGSIGKIELNQTTTYTLMRDRIKVYFICASFGFGKRF